MNVRMSFARKITGWSFVIDNDHLQNGIINLILLENAHLYDGSNLLRKYIEEFEIVWDACWIISGRKNGESTENKRNCYEEKVGMYETL